MPAFPRGPEGVSAAWLTEALATAHARIGSPPPVVRSFEVAPNQPNHGFIARITRLLPSYGPDSPPGPTSLIFKVPAYDPKGTMRYALTNTREVRFYRDIARADTSQFGTPVIYRAEIDPVGGGTVLLMEDLAAGATARAGDNLGGCTRAEAIAVAAHLARFHALMWEGTRLTALDWVPAFGTNADDVQERFCQQWPPFVATFGAGLSAYTQEVGAVLGSQLARVMRLFDVPPRTLLHGDYRLDNFFFVTDNGGVRPVVFDWMIQRGRGPADLAYFAAYSLPAADRREWEADLLRAYHEGLLSGGVTEYPFEACFRDYRVACLPAFNGLVAFSPDVDLANQRAVALWRVFVERFDAMIQDLHAADFLA